MFISNKEDPAFLYEGLVRAAFDNCSKGQDPWGYAKQEVYDNFVGIITSRGRRALATTIAKIVIDHKDNEDAVEKLLKLDEKIWELNDQGEVVDWLKLLKTEMEGLGY